MSHIWNWYEPLEGQFGTEALGPCFRRGKTFLHSSFCRSLLSETYFQISIQFFSPVFLPCLFTIRFDFNGNGSIDAVFRPPEVRWKIPVSSVFLLKNRSHIFNEHTEGFSPTNVPEIFSSPFSLLFFAIFYTFLRQKTNSKKGAREKFISISVNIETTD